MKRKNVRHQLCIFLSLLLIFYSALLPVSAVNLDESTHSTELTLPSPSSRSVPLDAYEGTFFVKNRGLGNYMQIDNNASYTNPSEGTKIELWEFDGGVYQKWRFIHVGEGFYKIVPYSVSGTNLCIAVQEGKENVSQRALVLEEYNSSDGYMRMQWTITPQTDATYIIRPRCGNSYPESDWVMAAGNGIGSNGRNVENRTRNDSLNYKDEWYLYYTILDCWHSNNDTVGYWFTNPTIFAEDHDESNSSHFEDSVDYARAQWSSALSIPLDRTTDANASFTCIRGTLAEYEATFGTIASFGALGTTHIYSYTIAQTNYGSEIKKINRVSQAKIFIFSTQRVLNASGQPTGEIGSVDIGQSMQKNVLVHEFGHALGYMGHSLDGDDLMYEVASTDYILTSADINHIKQIYNLRYNI